MNKFQKLLGELPREDLAPEVPTSDEELSWYFFWYHLRETKDRDVDLELISKYFEEAKRTSQVQLLVGAKPRGTTFSRYSFTFRPAGKHGQETS